MLYRIGNAFHKEFQTRVKVTSLNRNHEYVKALAAKNSNAAVESSHEYGTTFDISYLQILPETNQFFLPQKQRDFLEKFLFQLRETGTVHAIKERWKSCYHVCVIPESRS